jgi:hypothetical protein
VANEALVELVFLSGPGDVEGEFVAAQRVIEAFNRVVGPNIGIHLRPTRGRTDAQAGRGRPQSRINPLVRECDLFVMVFDKRYGSPSGKARSGTEEEFQIADRRARTSHSPHLLLFFKNLGAADLRHPDVQLRRVLQFKGRIDRGRKYYRLGFASRGDFQIVFFEQLMQWAWNVSPLWGGTHNTASPRRSKVARSPSRGRGRNGSRERQRAAAGSA